VSTQKLTPHRKQYPSSQIFRPYESTYRLRKKKTGCQRKHERTHIVARSKPPAERYTLPRLLLKASGMVRALRFYSPSNNNKDTCRLHTPGFSSRCNGAVATESPILKNTPPETLCSFLGTYLDMKATRTRLLSSLIPRWSVQYGKLPFSVWLFTSANYEVGTPASMNNNHNDTSEQSFLGEHVRW